MRNISCWLVLMPLIFWLFPLQVLSSSPKEKRFSFEYGKGTIKQPFLPIDHETISKCYDYSRFLLRGGIHRVIHTMRNNSGSCRFNFDPYHALLFITYKEEVVRAATDEEAAWSCAVSDEVLCDGVSQCLTDECGCKGNLTEVFYCFDGSGCVSFEHLCDGTQDCLDGSDECYCEDFVKISCPLLSSTPICLPVVPETCFGIDTMSNLYNCTILEKSDVDKCEAVKRQSKETKVLSPLYSCLVKNRLRLRISESENPLSLVSSFCKSNCTNETDFVVENWKRFCDNVYSGIFRGRGDFIFSCEKNSLVSGVESFHVAAVCDGKQDCKNGADEIGCPGRFYCSPNKTVEWVDPDKLCNHVKDCADGSDECETCDFGSLSSSKFLIQSKPILVVSIFMGLSIVIINLVEGYKCYHSRPHSKIGNIDRIFRLQIFLYDLLMGVYLCCIVLAAAMLRIKGDYCQLDRKWRASIFCSTLGVLFSVSSHGSLFTVAFVSIVRCLTCSSMVRDIKTKSIVLGSALINLLVLAHAILPLLPISDVQDIFRTEIFFTNLDENPFFSQNPINLSRMTRMYHGAFIRDSNTYTMLDMLRNTTSKGSIFDSEEISYYGNTGLCVHNVFSVQQSYHIYKLVYCTILALLLMTVVFTYIKILLKSRAIKVGVATLQEEGGPGDGSGQQVNMAQSLTLKVALIIGSQLTGWIPFIIAIVYYEFIAQDSAPPLVFEVFALIINPANSFLNPVFYSDVYKKVIGSIWAGWIWFVVRVTSDHDCTVTHVQAVEHLEAGLGTQIL